MNEWLGALDLLLKHVDNALILYAVYKCFVCFVNGSRAETQTRKELRAMLNDEHGSMGRMATKYTIGASTIFAILALAQRLAGYENTPLAVGLVGLVALLICYTVWQWARDNRSPELPAQERTSSIRQVSRGDQAPNVSLGSGTMHVTIGSVSPAETPLKMKPVERHLERTQPKIKYCGSKESKLYICPWASSGIRMPRNQEELQASADGILLTFENDFWEDGKGHDAINVIAKALYRTRNGDYKRVEYGVWLDASIRCTNFAVGDTQELVIMVHHDNIDDISLLDDNRDMGRHFSDPFAYLRIDAAADIESIEVSLVEQRRENPSKHTFRFNVARALAGYRIEQIP